MNHGIDVFKLENVEAVPETNVLQAKSEGESGIGIEIAMNIFDS
jgi:hypothetical protein